MEGNSFIIAVPVAGFAESSVEPCEIAAFSVTPLKKAAAVIMTRKMAGGGGIVKIIAAHVDRLDDPEDTLENVQELSRCLMKDPVCGQDEAQVLVTAADTLKAKAFTNLLANELEGRARVVFQGGVKSVGVDLRTGDVLKPEQLKQYAIAAFTKDVAQWHADFVRGRRLTLTEEGRKLYLDMMWCHPPRGGVQLSLGSFGRAPLMQIVDVSKPNWRKGYGIVLE